MDAECGAVVLGLDTWWEEKFGLWVMV